MLFRPARADDVPAIAELIYGGPTDDTAAIFGRADRAIQFGLAVMGVCDDLSWPATEVAEFDGAIVGLVQDGRGSADPDARRVFTAVIRRLGPRALLALPRVRAVGKVRMSMPEGAWVVRELHVAPTHRGQGFGMALLERAEERATRAAAPCMALSTRTNNPARRLYERAGYHVTGERTDRRYERLTGAAGRVSMEKPLATTPPLA